MTAAITAAVLGLAKEPFAARPGSEQGPRYGVSSCTGHVPPHLWVGGWEGWRCAGVIAGHGPPGLSLRRGGKDSIKMDVRAPVSPHPAAYAKLLTISKDAGGFAIC